LADGTWSITATDSHPTSGASSASTALSITVDTSRPTAPTSVDLITTSDTGTSTTDNNTNDNTPTMSATGGANGDTMTISATNGTTTVTCTYVIGSATNCTLPTLTDGSWNISSTLTDPAGNTSLASNALPITIDATGPQSLTPDLIMASDSGSSSTDNATSDSTPTLTLTGQSTGDVITMNATNGTTTISCSYTVGSASNCTLPTLTDGSWNISASVTDTAGNTGTTQSLDISVDTTPPTAPSGVDLVTASDTGNSSTDNNTNDTTPTMSASGGTNGDTMTISATNSGTTQSCSYVIGSATNCTLPTLTDGTWNISATLTDPAGNTSAPSTALPITIDGTAPSAPSGVDLAASSDSGASDSDNNTNDTTPTMSASGGTNGDTMTISATNGGTTQSCSYVIGSATNCTLPTLTDGTWNISATLTDPAGNTSAPSTALPITIDGTAPSAPTGLDLLTTSDTGSSNSDNFTGDNTPTLSAAGGTNGDTMTISATNGGTTVSCTYVIGVATNCTLPTLTDGTWNISARLTDPLGNESAASSALPVTIATSPPSRSAPDLLATSDNGSSNADNITNDSTPEISIPGALTGDVVTVSATNGTSTVTCTYTVGAATSCSLPTLSDGTWTVSASVTDAAGNTGPSTGSLSMTIDATPPTTPSGVDLAAASDTGASNTDNNTNDTTPTLSATGGANGDTMTISATKGNETKTCSYVVGVATSCDLPTLSDGTWSISVTATDSAGSTSAASPPMAINIGPDTSPSSVNDVTGNGLPSSTSTEMKPTVTSGKNSLTGRIRFAPHAAAHGAAAVVFTVYNTSGKIVSVITRRVKPTEKSASITVRNDGSLSVIRAHTTNKTGVSQSALRGANIMRGKTSAGRLPDGRPLLMGSLLGEVMYFKPNSAVLTPRTIALLNQLARTVNSQGGNLFVSGFARKNGIDTPKYLQNLSEQRALAVSMYLSAKGVRLWTTYRGFGAVTTEIGTPAERRVEVRWISVQ
jgi:outer membrane protein OmpA-like peptidoglycan-associated protein